MKEAIDEVTTAVDALLELSMQFERGQCIGWDVIEEIAGSRKENRGKHVISKWRKRLFRDRDIVTLCADGIGVRLLTHKETVREIPALRQRKAYRQVRRALKECATVDTARLTDHERRVLALQQMNMSEQRRELFRSQRQLEKGKGATEGNPRRAVAQ